MKNFGATTWVELGIVSPNVDEGQHDGTPPARGDLICVAVGVDDAQIHQVSLGLYAARNLRAELSGLIEELEQLEPEDEFGGDEFDSGQDLADVETSIQAEESQLSLVFDTETTNSLLPPKSACPFGVSCCDGECLTGGFYGDAES